MVISCRNVIRSFGGAMGLAIASLIISNTLISEINHQRSQGVLPNDYLNYMQNHIYSKIDTSVLTHDQVVVVRQMYMTSIRNFSI